MHLTRLGYNVIVAIWLLPMIAVDIYGNTVSTGAISDVYYYKAMLDGLLVCYAVWQCFRPGTATKANAMRRVADKSDPSFDLVIVYDFAASGHDDAPDRSELAGIALHRGFHLHGSVRRALGRPRDGATGPKRRQRYLTMTTPSPAPVAALAPKHEAVA